MKVNPLILVAGFFLAIANQTQAQTETEFSKDAVALANVLLKSSLIKNDLMISIRELSQIQVLRILKQKNDYLLDFLSENNLGTIDLHENGSNYTATAQYNPCSANTEIKPARSNVDQDSMEIANLLLLEKIKPCADFIAVEGDPVVKKITKNPLSTKQIEYHFELEMGGLVITDNSSMVNRVTDAEKAPYIFDCRFPVLMY